VSKKGVTLALLWHEYRLAHPDGYGYSRFCDLYRAWAGTLEVTMRHEHKAGEKLFVVYTGHKMEAVNPQTGEVYKVEVFVAPGARAITLTRNPRGHRICPAGQGRMSGPSSSSAASTTARPGSSRPSRAQKATDATRG
jgi:hypothetical protein